MNLTPVFKYAEKHSYTIESAFYCKRRGQEKDDTFDDLLDLIEFARIWSFEVTRVSFTMVDDEDDSRVVDFTPTELGLKGV